MEKKLKFARKLQSYSVHYAHKFDGWIAPLCEIDAPDDFIVTKDLRKLNCKKCVELLLTTDRFFNEEFKNQDFQ